jgi:hypothetical protein
VDGAGGSGSLRTTLGSKALLWFQGAGFLKELASVWALHGHTARLLYVVQCWQVPRHSHSPPYTPESLTHWGAPVKNTFPGSFSLSLLPLRHKLQRSWLGIWPPGLPWRLQALPGPSPISEAWGYFLGSPSHQYCYVRKPDLRPDTGFVREPQEAGVDVRPLPKGPVLSPHTPLSMPKIP